MKNILDFKNFILNEDGGGSCGSGDAAGGGVAMASLSSTNGMGAISAPQAGSPGNVWGMTSGKGSTTGSGDRAATIFGTYSKDPAQLNTDKKKKKSKKIYTKLKDFVQKA
jgi:hypothetical protein